MASTRRQSRSGAPKTKHATGPAIVLDADDERVLDAAWNELRKKYEQDPDSLRAAWARELEAAKHNTE